MELPLVFETEKENPSYYKLVPWISWDEWNFVRESLFSSSQPSIAAAQRRISTWRSRGCLPVLIEVTASIIEAQQMDPFFRNDLIDDSLKSEETLAMLYSMSIMRLVNGAVEKTREADKFTIAEAASRINLPRTLIDIRHEGSHRDLPSLQVLRLASVKALDWLKSYYWEPQKKAIPCQRDEITNARKQTKSELRKLAKALNANHPVKHPSFKSEGFKKQIASSLKILVRLYSTFPSHTAAVLLEFLLKGVESSDDNEVEPHKSETDLGPSNSKSLPSSTDVWKLIVARISFREPELLLSLLKSILEMVKSQNATKSEVGVDILYSQHKSEIHRAARLSSLIVWLIESYWEVKHSRQLGSRADIQDSPAETVRLKVALTDLLRKFLLVFSPGSDQFEWSIILAEMIGNSHMVRKLKKLSVIRLSNADHTEDSYTHTSIEQIIQQEEESISRAAKNLEFLKQRRLNAKLVRARSDDTHKEDSSWRIAKSWISCPIGMLPSEYGTAGLLPVLGEAVSLPEAQQISESNEYLELDHNTHKRDCNFDLNLFENSSVSKKRRVVIENSQTDDHDEPQEPFKGQLLIGGIWKKVAGNELLAMSSAVRILV